MPVAAGTTLGRYQVQSLIGAGAMGEVYLAHDSQLRRPVALKLLPATFTRDEDRLKRFEQEAQAASALNHPNILTIYEIGEIDSLRFIAMEYVEGETLRAHLSRSQLSGDGQHPGTGIKLHEVLDISIQIASALSSAQAAGIAHRDIKPENLMLRSDGYVKILDFGLAKLTEKPETTETEAPTRAMVHTSPGAVMGTVNYMSPEQASGHLVDPRTDIWSLGVLLYEMLTARLPFEGPTPSHVIVAILEKDPPPLGRYITDVPEALEWIVTKALTKNRDDRYQTAREMLTDLRRLKQRLEANAEIERSLAPDPGSGRPFSTASASHLGASTLSASPLDQRTTPPGISTASTVPSLGIARKKFGVVPLALVVVALLALIGGGYLIWTKMRPAPATSHTFHKIRLLQLTNTGKAGVASLSPDGKYVVHQVNDGAQASLWVRQTATTSNVQIVPSSSARYVGLTISPDGNYVYYVTYDGNNPLGVTYQIPVLGGTPRKVIEDVDTPITFSPDGKRFAFIRNFPKSGETALMVANVDGSEQRKVSSRMRPNRFLAGAGIGPSWSPAGERIACPTGATENGRDSYTFTLIDATTGAEAAATTQRWNSVQRAAWTPDGASLLVSAQEDPGGPSQILQVSLADGSVERVTNDLNNYNDVSISSDGSKLVTVQSQASSSIWFGPISDADSATKITTGRTEGFRGLAVLPDGRILYTVSGVGTADLFIINSDGSNVRQLTSNASLNGNPTVSADGRTIVFVSTRSGSPHLWRIDSDGNNLKQITNGVAEITPEISPDGQWIVYQSISDLGLWKISIEGGTPVRILDKLVGPGAVSPDGKLIACRFREQDLTPFKLGIIDFATGEILKAIDAPPPETTYRWSADSRAVLYATRHSGVSNIWSQPIDGSAPKQLTNFKSDLIFGFALSKDGKSIALSRGSVSNDVILISAER